jgi:hypothetical protein
MVTEKSGLSGKLEVDDIAVLDDVLAPLHPEHAFISGRRETPAGNEVLIVDYLGLDEALFEVGVYAPGGMSRG